MRLNHAKMKPLQLYQPYVMDNSAVLMRTFSIFLLFVLAFVSHPSHKAQSIIPSVHNHEYLLTPLLDDSNIHSTANTNTTQIAWLMSYPNSGTSYTHRLIRKVSNRTTATNYGIEHLFDGKNILVHPDWRNGPFLTYPDQQIPNHILTKTHCGGRCVHCGPSAYIETPTSFQQRCFRTRGFFGSNHSERVGHYSSSQVSKAIHLVRNPFNNVVSRFHLDHAQRLNNTMYQNRFPNNAKGFQQWCKDVDIIFGREEQKNFDKDLMKMIRKVPCHGEFYRYTQWHNLAIATLKTMKIPVHVLYYEDYNDKWEQTLIGMLDFLELENATPETAQKFVPGKEYVDYYTSKQRHAIQKLIAKVSTNETWQLLKHYMP